MVVDIFKPINKKAKIEETYIDNSVTRLHHKVTFIILIVASLMLTSVQYFGKPIHCVGYKDMAYSEDLLNTFCWIQSTFTLPKAYNQTVGVNGVPAPGIDQYEPGDEKIYHRYYQWVWIVLFLQGISFYIPRFIWKLWEGKRLKSLVLGLNNPVIDDKEKSEKTKMLVQYLMINFHHHNTYFFHFVVVEVLNFINVIAQIFIVDAFLGGSFTTYGPDVLNFSEADMLNRTDPMIRVFPRMTKCTFFYYGPSGDVQRIDHLCLLPLNILNEKIYIFLWFWFIIVAALSGLMLVYRAIMIIFPSMRKRILRKRAHLVKASQMKMVLSAAKLGDWFLLYYLAKNIDQTHFQQLMEEFTEEMKTDRERREDQEENSLLGGSNEKNAKDFE